MKRVCFILIAVLTLSSCMKNIEDGIIEELENRTENTTQPVSINFMSQAVSPMMYKFTNASTGCDSYRWDFGDGTWASGKDAMHTYDAAGKYTVTLTGTANGTNYDMRETITVNEPVAYIIGYTLYSIPYENKYYKVVFKDDALLPSAWDFQTSYTKLLMNSDIPYSVQLPSRKKMENLKSHEYYTIQVIRNTNTYNTAGETFCLKGKLKVSTITSSYKPEYVLTTESGATSIGIRMEYTY